MPTTDEVVKTFSDIRIPTNEEIAQQQSADTTADVVTPQLEEATQLAEVAAQTATQQATDAQAIQSELDVAKQALAEKDKLISEMSMQNELSKFQEFSEPTPPVRPVKRMVEDTGYMSEEELQNAQIAIDDEFNNLMNEYDQQTKEYYTVHLPEYQNSLKTKEELERKSIYATLESEVPDIGNMQPQIEAMIAKNPFLQSLSGDDQIINAYIMVKGINHLNKPAEKPQEERYNEMLNDDNFKAFYEQQRLQKAQGQPEVPPMGNGGDISLNIPKRPTSFEELRNKWSNKQ